MSCLTLSMTVQKQFFAKHIEAVNKLHEKKGTFLKMLTQNT